MVGKARSAVLRACFAVIPAFLAAGLGFGTGRTEGPRVAPGFIEVCYAVRTAGGETLACRSYSASGGARGPAVAVGRLGLVAEAQTAGAVPGAIVTTTGFAVKIVRAGRVHTMARAPADWTLLAVRRVAGRIWTVAENVAKRQDVIGRLGANGRWDWVKTPIPAGITTLLRQPSGQLAVAVMSSHRARVLSGKGRPLASVGGITPQGTVGFAEGKTLVPFASGSNGFGLALVAARQVQYQLYPSVYRAVIEVTDTSPVWGVSPEGMVPFRQGRFRFSERRRWPRPLPGTITLVGSGRPWMLVVDGNSQGVWFNVQTGRYGPGFQINTPWPAVVRAIALGS
ncbi:MAG: hypothetical protein M0Z53_01145 [Thermaerobacter sp.]|nr:hypothetical protein [Thermaerobacter sp.]